MDFGILNIFQVLGALSFFVYGMKMMSDGIQRAAGAQLRNILRTMTKNRFLGVFTGFLTTGVLQSSSATTVMTVSFVNAGLLTLVESAGIMMGANIGTTITGWIVSILGFKIQLSLYSIPLFALGVPMLFTNKGNIKYWGEFIIGFAILFLGLSYLKDAVPDISSNSYIFENLQHFTEWGFASRLLFVFIGAIIAVLVQSSSAAMAITLTICTQGWLPFEIGAALILGENIGTTITAEIASWVGNTSARRAARIHSLFNIIGVTWMVILIPVVLPILASFVEHFMGYNNPYTSPEDMPVGLSAFHTAFNLVNVIVMLGFVKWLVKVATMTVKTKNEKVKTKQPLKFITTASRTPELALVELQKEVAYFGSTVAKMSSFARIALNSTESHEQYQMLIKIKEYEQQTDQMEKAITQYITKLASQEVTTATSLKLRSYLNICNDLERIGDIYYQIAKTIDQKIETKAYFTPDQQININEMIDKVGEAFQFMTTNLKVPYQKVDKASAVAIEKEIDELKKKLRQHNNSKLNSKHYRLDSAMIYINLASALEDVGNHIMNVTEAIIGEI